MLKEIALDDRGDDQHVRSALRDGFFLVRNTVPETLLDEAYAMLGAFFELPAEVKADCRVPGANGQSGYLPPLVEQGEKGRTPDWKELFHWGAPLPSAHPLRERYPARYPQPYYPDHLIPGIGAALGELHLRMSRFQLDVVRRLAGALGAAPGYFEEMLEDGPVVNRATWYPPMEQAPSADHVWMVEHQDFDLITALPRATAAGLEVLIDGEWTPPGPPRATRSSMSAWSWNGSPAGWPAPPSTASSPHPAKAAAGSPSCSSATPPRGRCSPRSAAPRWTASPTGTPP